MPRSTREWAQRRLKDSLGNLEWALDKIVGVEQVYVAQHPEIATPLAEVAMAITVLCDTIAAVRKAF